MYKLYLEKTRGTRDQIANIRWIIKKAREFPENIYFCFIDYVNVFDCVDQNKLWKILKEMGIPEHLTCLLRNLHAGQEATVRIGHGTTDWFQIGKGVHQGCILSPCLFNLNAEYIMRNAGLDEAQAYGIKWRRTKDPLDKSERGERKSWLKAQHSENKIMPSGPITSWQIDGETVSNFILGGSKITADGDFSHEIKRRLLLGRKVMTNLDIIRSRDITLPTKVHLVKAMVFPVVMYGCESWTVKKAECWRIDAFELVVLEKTLESLLDCKKIQPVNSKGNQPWIFIGRTDADVEAPVLWPPDGKTHWKRPWFWQRLRAGGEGGNRRWDGWITSPTQLTWVWASSGIW